MLDDERLDDLPVRDGIRFDVEVDVHLRAHVLANLAADGHDAIGMGLVQQRGVLHVLGPEAKDDLHPLVRRQADVVEHFGAETQAVRAERDPERSPSARSTRATTRFIAGEPMNSATNRLRGRS